MEIIHDHIVINFPVHLDKRLIRMNLVVYWNFSIAYPEKTVLQSSDFAKFDVI